MVCTCPHVITNSENSALSSAGITCLYLVCCVFLSMLQIQYCSIPLLDLNFGEAGGNTGQFAVCEFIFYLNMY